MNPIDRTAPSQTESIVFVFDLALLPRVLLQCTGQYLFVLPYATRWRSARRTN